MLKLLFWPFKIARFVIFMGIGLLLLWWSSYSLSSRGYHTFFGTKITATMHQQIDLCQIIGKGTHRGKTVLLKTKCVEAVPIAKRDFGEGNYRLSKKTNLNISYPAADGRTKNVTISSYDLRVSKLPLAEKFEAIYDPDNIENIQIPLRVDLIGLYALLLFLGLIFSSSALYQIIKGQSLIFTIVQKAMKKKAKRTAESHRREPHF